MQLRNQLFIGGQWCDATSGETIDVRNPATGETITHVQKGSEADLQRAIAVAKDAYQNVWRQVNPLQRSACLNAVAAAITANLEFLAGVETDDVGKPIAESRNIDISGAAATWSYFANLCTEVMGEVQFSPYNEVFDYTLREPLGVVGAIIPWNFPFMIAARKIATALAAGNTVVIKPSSWTPLSTLLFGELLNEAGLPPGVVNIVPADGPVAGRVFAESPDLEEISFTGSTEVGISLFDACAPHLKGCTLELGGKSPALVLPDCDVDETVAGLLFGAYLNQGECCCAATRLILHEQVYDEVVERFVAGSRALRIGPPRDEATQLGSLVHPAHLQVVEEYLEAGKAAGATVLCGGRVLRDGALAKGLYVEPTVFADVTPDMRIWREEIFGPVVVVAKARDVDEMVALANDTHYGLTASLWTTNLKTAHSLAPRLRCGTVWCNLHNFVFPSAPYGGCGSSGLGRELGKEGLWSLTRTKNVMVSLFPSGFRWYD